MSSSSNTTNANTMNQPEAARPHTSLIALNGSFDLPMKDISSPPRNDLESASMIVHVEKKVKKSSNNGGNVQARDGSNKDLSTTPSK